MKIAIIGFSREGQSVFKFLRKDSRFKKSEIWILDQNPAVKKSVSPVLRKRLHFQLGKGYLKNLARFDVIFRSPGVLYTFPEIQKAKHAGVSVSSATKLFFEEIRKTKEIRLGRPVVIGVTGTKGKGTTCTLIYEILKNAGKKVVLAGNIGKPMLSVLSQAKKADFVVLELSSFQLHDLTISPDIAVVLDIFPDHQDVHKSLKEYYDAKTSIGRFQKKSDTIFYFKTNSLSRRIASVSHGKKNPIQPQEDSLKKNYDMARVVAEKLGISNIITDATFKRFKGLEHRLEFVRKLNHISFYNDSCATNPIAAAAAVRSFRASTVLIAGGRDAGFDYRPLGSALKSSSVELVILFGENKNKIARAIRDKKKPVLFSSRLELAVQTAYHFARDLRNHSSEAIVLFSPASKSFDMFKSYADRGCQYKKAVLALKG